jgi:CDP-glucose 4,6-dehydratase
MHYLITGHTGFKGSWLVLMLNQLGHEVSGIALDPVKNSLFKTAKISKKMSFDERCDIRDVTRLNKKIQKISPDVVIHLAAQPLVRKSYSDPRETIETNAIGTFNVLDAVSKTLSVKANLIITTDKVYKNVNQKKGYLESDHLGGDDPYSASKAMADIVTQSFVKSFPGIPTAIARAGNVIGGGDVSADRLIPDLINGFIQKKPALIRYPSAVRPWQHVLDCLNGYLTLVDKMLNNKMAGEWNFGPDERSFKDVKTVADYLKNRWGHDASWITDEKENPHEAELLALDATKAETQLNWHNKLSFEETLDWTLDWHKAVTAGANPLEQIQDQINKFRELN